MEQSADHPKSKEEDFVLIKKALSQARFESYRETADEADEVLFARYQWNAEVSECFYATLTVLEVLMRNRLSEAIAVNFRNPNWLTSAAAWLGDEQKNDVEEGIRYLAKRGHPITQDRMVQEMSFGFWTSLLSRHYEVLIFRNIAAGAFPGMTRAMRTRDNVSRRIESIRKLRNRIFHFRRIWNRLDLLAEFDGILEAIDWLNPKAKELLIPAQCRARFVEMLNRKP
jgi:hypothetical protein